MDRLTFIQNKIVTPEEAERIINGWRLKGQNIAFTNGCFDILHQGHVTYLAKAASEANRLVLAINTDNSVKRQGKGDDRPVNNESSRGLVIAALDFVDLVVYFNDDTPFEVIKRLKPDVLVKGGDYNENQTDPSAKDYIVGSDIVSAYGGQVKTIPLVEGFSTTAIINKIGNS